VEIKTRIVVLAKTGYFRDSLIALLRTLTEIELFLTDDCLVENPFGISLPLFDPHVGLLIIDFDSFNGSISSHVEKWRKRWSKARLIGLVDNGRQTRLAHNLGIDFILDRSVTAGDLLRVVSSINPNGDALSDERSNTQYQFNSHPGDLFPDYLMARI